MQLNSLVSIYRVKKNTRSEVITAQPFVSLLFGQPEVPRNRVIPGLPVIRPELPPITRYPRLTMRCLYVEA